MRKHQIVILLLGVLVLFGACRPRGILTSRQMRKVLYDLHRAEAILQVQGLTYGNQEDVAKYYQGVLDKHHLTQAEFDSSLVWYTDHPQLFNKIYPKLLKQVQDEKAAWEALEISSQPVLHPLRPLDDVKREMQHGFDTELWREKTDPTIADLGPVGFSKIQPENDTPTQSLETQPAVTDADNAKDSVDVKKEDKLLQKRNFRKQRIFLNERMKKSENNEEDTPQD